MMLFVLELALMVYFMYHWWDNLIKEMVVMVRTNIFYKAFHVKGAYYK